MTTDRESLETKLPTLRHFRCDHLPEHLRAVSEPFCFLAESFARGSSDSAESGEYVDFVELEVALRKLLEAKDAAVRSTIR